MLDIEPVTGRDWLLVGGFRVAMRAEGALGGRVAVAGESTTKLDGERNCGVRNCGAVAVTGPRLLRGGPATVCGCTAGTELFKLGASSAAMPRDD